MPLSPVSKQSPSRHMGLKNYKQGCGIDGGLPAHEKDDDLALFDELQARERENFLLQSSDDFEDILSSKFSDYRTGMAIPSQGESSVILHEDVEKNDYEWLTSPPETPLFPSLDDEPIPANIPSRGRTQSQQVAVSKSSTKERSGRSSRRSASPSRLSLSPRSGGSLVQSQGNPTLVPHASAICSTRSASPSRRESPSRKSLTSGPRSSSPIPQRMNTGSVPLAGARGVRGVSPQRVSRGKSPSPKIKAQQVNIPGFSCDVPPNLRTSLFDRPASYMRGSSPDSKNGQDSSSRVRRQSMSPTGTRSAISSYRHEQDWLSSRGQGSIAGEDLDSLQSMGAGEIIPSSNKESSATVVSGSHHVAETDETMDSITHRGEGKQPTEGCCPSLRGTSSQGSEPFSNYPNTNVSEAEGAGISLLLERSSNANGLVVQDRAFTASSVLPIDDLSYARHTSNGTRSSIGRGSFSSSSSSIDLSSSRVMETRMQQQFSGRKADTENYRCEMESQSPESSLCGTSNYSPKSSAVVTATSKMNLEGSARDTNNAFSVETGELTVRVESHGHNRTKSYTLEEATDTILFCSSIVHDLAYSAATIAMEKEKEQEASEAMEGILPAGTILAKSTCDRKDPGSGRIIIKRSLNPHIRASRQKPIDTDREPPLSSNLENEEVHKSLTHNVGLPHNFDSSDTVLQSKCNCTVM
ncbi:hypothetical protein SAY86_002107 [Trapa natans]|uniref:Uncharacterized protein n=1 Tax=Trapa natans TaxID=22666 RepID=A0AAN7R4F5_TRANT|nr:hypothetical protein SAY86_002107 [Trapa natans]